MNKPNSSSSKNGFNLFSERNGLKPVVFPSFPTPAELAHAAATVADAPPPKPVGLFEAVLQSRPEAMYEDALEHPDKYEDGVPQLLEDLASSRRATTDTERELLDRAVLDFTRKLPAVPKPPTPPSPPNSPSNYEPGDTNVFTGPEEEPTAFWWL